VLLLLIRYVIIYRSTELSDESLFGSCVMAGVFFITTQLVKTFILATFMIIPEETEVHSLAAVPVILVNMLDYLAIYMMHGWLQKKAKPNHLRILAVALGWAGAEAIVHYLIPLWIGARDIEFSWEYIEMGLLSNINILLHLSASTAVWLGMRNDLGPLGMSVVAITCTGQLILSAFGNHMKKSLALGFSSCSVLGMHFTIAISLFALVGINYTIYTKRTETTNSQQRW